MTKLSTSITINTSQEAVRKVLSDVAHWQEWTPTVIKVEVLNTPELKLNNQYKVFQPKLQPAEWTVTVLTPPSSFTWESKSSGMHMAAEHILTAKGGTKPNSRSHLHSTAGLASSLARSTEKCLRTIFKRKHSP